MDGGPRTTERTAGTPIRRGTVLGFVDGLRSDLGLEFERLLAGRVWMRLHTPGWPCRRSPPRPSRPGALWQTPWWAYSPGRIEPQVAETGKPLTSHVSASLWRPAAGPGWNRGRPAIRRAPPGPRSAPSMTIAIPKARPAWRLEDELNAMSAGARPAPGGLAAGGAGDRLRLAVDARGLPKLDLPGHLTESRWPRCAVAPRVPTRLSRAPSFWGGGGAVVLAPGSGYLRQEWEYSRRGSRVQEALVPVWTVTAPEGGPNRSRS